MLVNLPLDICVVLWQMRDWLVAKLGFRPDSRVVKPFNDKHHLVEEICPARNQIEAICTKEGVRFHPSIYEDTEVSLSGAANGPTIAKHIPKSELIALRKKSKKTGASFAELINAWDPSRPCGEEIDEEDLFAQTDGGLADPNVMMDLDQPTVRSR